jgi:hypothetical protein
MATTGGRQDAENAQAQRLFFVLPSHHLHNNGSASRCASLR